MAEILGRFIWRKVVLFDGVTQSRLIDFWISWTYNPPQSESEIGSRGERQPLPTSAFLPRGSNIQLCKRRQE